VDCLLVTGFDRTYGGCWYWVNAEAGIKKVTFAWDPEDSDRLSGVIFEVNKAFEAATGPIVTVDKGKLERAWAVMVDQRPIRSDLVDQFVHAMQSPDELPDIDADAADCLIQYALFGEVVFG
jgi:hypothetical protein